MNKKGKKGESNNKIRKNKAKILGIKRNRQSQTKKLRYDEGKDRQKKGKQDIKRKKTKTNIHEETVK